jgi:hypothetical protein
VNISDEAVEAAAKGNGVDDHYTMPDDRTFCVHFRCCREYAHAGSCEVDIAYLDDSELEAIRKSGEE